MRTKPAYANEPTSRKTTADILRRLRGLSRATRMLKAEIDAAQRREASPRLKGRRSADK